MHVFIKWGLLGFIANIVAFLSSNVLTLMELIKFSILFCSDVLAAFLRSDCQESRTKEITIEDFKPKTVEAFLKFMYIEAVQTVDIDICLLQMSDKVRIFIEDNNFFKKSHSSNLCM